MILCSDRLAKISRNEIGAIGIFIPIWKGHIS